MDGIVPVKIVIGVCSVPASVMGLERVMRPANAGVRAGNNDRLPSKSERPDIRRVRVLDSRLDGRRSAGSPGLQRRLVDRALLRKLIMNPWVALDTRYLRASSQRVGDFWSALHQNGVNDIKGAMLDVAVAQPLQDRFLCAVRLVQKGLVNVSALLCLCGQTSRTAKVGLIGKHDEKFGPLSVGSVFHNPRRDLVRRGDSVRWETGVTRRSPRLSDSCRTKRKQDKHHSRDAKHKAN